MEGGQENPTRILIAVNQSSVKGYPHPSISSSNAFHWALEKLIRSTRHEDFKLFLLHVQVPDEDGFDDMDNIFAFPINFKNMKSREKIRVIHLLEYFVRCRDEIGVGKNQL
ncbi:hypothetical protein KI387_002550 [Taxus chinensis]|uniref:UspA domain-containing protein n=1 Tax=Taxus chinensis TaxID=29808 RepID=A0AA38LR68_TAXCH|nr:hypothetical protein KI387_002550 [Taxus chinensis]